MWLFFGMVDWQCLLKLIRLSRPSLRGTAYEGWKTRTDSLWLEEPFNLLQERHLRADLSGRPLVCTLLRSSPYWKPVPVLGAVSFWLAITRMSKTRQRSPKCRLLHGGQYEGQLSVYLRVCVVAIVNDPSLLGSWARSTLSGVVLASR